MSGPERVAVLGSRISVCDVDGALRHVEQRLASDEGGYVCFTNVHGVVTGREDPAFRDITNGSFMSVADGKPVFWVGRSRSRGAMGHVPGPDFFDRALQRFASRRHFLYGSSPEVLARLETALRARIPDLQICGSISPPFRTLTEDERQAHLREIRESGAEFVWVSLGAPKQERWMAQNWTDLRPALLYGVGAAFDFHAGTVRRAPPVMRALGLEWLYRLLQEPRRLWRRYLRTNLLFSAYLTGELLRGGAKRE